MEFRNKEKTVKKNKEAEKKEEIFMRQAHLKKATSENNAA